MSHFLCLSIASLTLALKRPESHLSLKAPSLGGGADSESAYPGDFENNANFAVTWASASSSRIVHNVASRRDKRASGSVLVVKIRFRLTTRNYVFRVVQFYHERDFPGVYSRASEEVDSRNKEKRT